MAMRKGSLMNSGNLIWILVLAGMVCACNSGPPIDNTGGGGTGGSSGVVDACIDDANKAVYDGLSYTSYDNQGNPTTFTGDKAASEIGSDCIFGNAESEYPSEPPLEGCGEEAGAVILCGSPCNDAELIQTLADCVAQCTQDATAEVSPPGLSDECVGCTGDTVACGARYCVAQCATDTNDPACIQCRCDNNCVQSFDTCSGLEPSIVCP